MNRNLQPTLGNPFREKKSPVIDPITANGSTGLYEKTLEEGKELVNRPKTAAGFSSTLRQHFKGRMTTWERVRILCDAGTDPNFLYQNWGPNLDGASLVTAIVKIQNRDVAVYAHDFTVRAGSMDATNGRKLARLFILAYRRGIPVVGMNDSAGAYVPAGVGGLDGYAEAFTAIRKISGRVPSIMCMFGFNAGGGSYMPRQGSFVIQPKNTFFGLTGPSVVKAVLGEDITPDQLGGPSVHSLSGVTDFVVEDEVAALRMVRTILTYLPSSNDESPPFLPTSDPIDRDTSDVDILLRNTLNSPTGFNTPIDIGIILQQICDYGQYLEVQADRAQNTLCAFARLGGHVTGIVANNSAVASGQIDIDAAYKNARFIRFCNLYNIPVVFLEDTTGFLPGKEQEAMGIVQAGRAMLDSIIDLRTPRLLVIIRNAFGGAYASYNNYSTGADHVIALPLTRLAVMGPAGVEFVYKKELKSLRNSVDGRVEKRVNQGQKRGDAEAEIHNWLLEQETELAQRYERELMNPREALSLGSISSIVMPSNLRKEIISNLIFHLDHYQPGPMSDVQREFF